MSPKYYNMSPKQRAKDSQINAIFDDVMSDMASKVIFNPEREKDPEVGKTEVGKIADKWCPVIEQIIPDGDKGFINGMPYPSAADFACLILELGVTPFAGCWKIGDIDI